MARPSWEARATAVQSLVSRVGGARRVPGGRAWAHRHHPRLPHDHTAHDHGHDPACHTPARIPDCSRRHCGAFASCRGTHQAQYYCKYCAVHFSSFFCGCGTCRRVTPCFQPRETSLSRRNRNDSQGTVIPRPRTSRPSGIQFYAKRRHGQLPRGAPATGCGATRERVEEESPLWVLTSSGSPPSRLPCSV